MSDRETNDSVVDQAAVWYARMQEPESETEVLLFEAWLARDPSHPRAYAEIDAVNAALSAVPREQRADQRADCSAQQGVVKLLDRPASVIWQPALAAAILVFFVITAVVMWQGAASPAYAAISNPGPAVRRIDSPTVPKSGSMLIARSRSGCRRMSGRFPSKGGECDWCQALTNGRLSFTLAIS